MEVARAEEENQADRWVKKQLVSRFRKVLYDRYGGDLMAKIILATGGLSKEALAIVNDISYDKYLEHGAVHDVPKKDERQNAGPRQRVLNEAQVARNKAKLAAKGRRRQGGTDVDQADELAKIADELTRPMGGGRVKGVELEPLPSIQRNALVPATATVASPAAAP